MRDFVISTFSSEVTSTQKYKYKYKKTHNNQQTIKTSYSVTLLFHKYVWGHFEMERTGANPTIIIFSHMDYEPNEM